MSAKADTWMAFYVGDYVTNTMHLTTRQHGGYLLLILTAWKACGVLPGTDAALSAIARLSAKEWREDGDTLKAFLTRRGDEWIHERVMFEWNEAHRLSDLKSKAGREGANRRWAGRANGRPMADPLANAQQNDAPSQSHTPEEEITLTVRVEREGADALAPPKGAQHGKSGTRIPDAWRPCIAGRAFASERGLDPDATADAFTDWWTAASGAKAVKRDWDAAFRTWCRRDSGSSMGPRPASPVRPSRGNDAVFEHLAVIANRGGNEPGFRG